MSISTRLDLHPAMYSKPVQELYRYRYHHPDIWEVSNRWLMEGW